MHAAAILVGAATITMVISPSPAVGPPDSRTLAKAQRAQATDLDFHIDELITAIHMARSWWWWNIDELSEAEIFFEENTTDGDLGIQFFLDGDAWDRVSIFTPNLRRMVDVKVKGKIGDIGLTEVFSESAEPSFDELPRDEFLAMFDEGDYLMLARSNEGGFLIGTAELTKNMPDPVEITSPAPDEGGDEPEIEVDADEPLVIEWTSSPDPDAPDSVIEAYQVVVEKDKDDERLRVYSIDMGPDDTTVTLAPGFLEPGKDYKVEIIVIESSNNKSITELEFETEDDDG